MSFVTASWVLFCRRSITDRSPPHLVSLIDVVDTIQGIKDDKPNMGRCGLTLAARLTRTDRSSLDAALHFQVRLVWYLPDNTAAPEDGPFSVRIDEGVGSVNLNFVIEALLVQGLGGYRMAIEACAEGGEEWIEVGSAAMRGAPPPPTQT